MLLVMAGFASAYADTPAGKISKFEGKVLLYDGVSPRPADVETPDTPVFKGNRVTTKKDASALVDLISGDRVAVAESSSMEVQDIEMISPTEGRVIFHIRKRGEVSGMKVALTTSVIGVKGTQFLVETSADNKQNVYLKEGRIEVTALEGEFKKYAEAQIDEYEAYIRKMAGEYDKYVKELQEQFVQYVKGFEMEAGTAVSIDGKEVRNLQFTDDIKKAFDILEQ
jgi:hypothetical protein